MSDDEPTFTAQEAAKAQTALRWALGLEPEQFPLRNVISMLFDEIDQLRAAGKTDRVIAELLSDITHKPITAEQIERYCAMPLARGHARCV